MVQQQHTWRPSPFARSDQVDLSKRLPDELLLQVMSYLEGPTLGQCAQVCRRWRSVANDGPLWRCVSNRDLHGGRDGIELMEHTLRKFERSRDLRYLDTLEQQIEQERRKHRLYGEVQGMKIPARHRDHLRRLLRALRIQPYSYTTFDGQMYWGTDAEAAIDFELQGSTVAQAKHLTIRFVYRNRGSTGTSAEDGLEASLSSDGIGEILCVSAEHGQDAASIGGVNVARLQQVAEILGVADLPPKRFMMFLLDCLLPPRLTSCQVVKVASTLSYTSPVATTATTSSSAGQPAS